VKTMLRYGKRLGRAQMNVMFRSGMIFAVVCALVACSATTPLEQAQTPNFISHSVDLAAADWYRNRPLVDLFAKDGPYERVEVIAPSDDAAKVVTNWLREDGVAMIKPVGSGAQDVITLVGYWTVKPISPLRQ
jgi:ABC-type glycerol-3-phosphate transport system substrate-binding protein